MQSQYRAMHYSASRGKNYVTAICRRPKTAKINLVLNYRVTYIPEPPVYDESFWVLVQEAQLPQRNSAWAAHDFLCWLTGPVPFNAVNPHENSYKPYMLRNQFIGHICVADSKCPYVYSVTHGGLLNYHIRTSSLPSAKRIGLSAIRKTFFKLNLALRFIQCRPHWCHHDQKSSTGCCRNVQ